jgi:hypothetical protein
MKPTVEDDRSEMARIAVDAFVAASLACMQNPAPGSREDEKCERLIDRARRYDACYVHQLCDSLRLGAQRTA